MVFGIPRSFTSDLTVSSHLLIILLSAVVAGCSSNANEVADAQSAQNNVVDSDEVVSEQVQSSEIASENSGITGDTSNLTNPPVITLENYQSVLGSTFALITGWYPSNTVSNYVRMDESFFPVNDQGLNARRAIDSTFICFNGGTMRTESESQSFINTSYTFNDCQLAHHSQTHDGKVNMVVAHCQRRHALRT